jgi:SMI1 / KNR4 family (SUKH-1)
MKEKNLDDWLLLLKDVNVDWHSMHEEPRNLGIYTDEELSAYEMKIGCVLPCEYKGYLKTFGPGLFGKCQFRVDTLCLDSPNIGISYSLEGILDCINSETFSDKERTVIARGYPFGDSEKAYTNLFFDLNTYDSTNRDCDIYGLYTDHDGTGTLYFLGRSFFEFVRDCCVGDKAFKDFPELVYQLDEVAFCARNADWETKNKYWELDLIIIDPPKMFSPFPRTYV